MWFYRPLPCCVMLALSSPAAAGYDPESHLFGDPGGLRSVLEQAGVKFETKEVSEEFVNAVGGLRRGAAYVGKATLGVTINTQALGLWPGGTFRISATELRGRSPSSDLVGSLNGVSSIEGSTGVTLSKFYYEQGLFNDTLSIRVGQYSIDSEFFSNNYNSNFENSYFGLPTVASYGLPGEGGTVHPLLTPNIRVKLSPTPAFSLLVAAFSGDSLGYSKNSVDQSSGGAVSAAMSGGMMGIIEAQYTTDPETSDADLASAYRIGGYVHPQSFADQRLDSQFRSLADPSSTGIPLRRRANWSLYGGFDQRLWSDPRGTGLDRGVGVFARVIGGPADRNVIDLAVSAGLIWVGALDSRPADVIGFGINYAHISQQARALDADRVRLAGANMPIRSGEMALELNYQATSGPFRWVPNVQYIIRPGGGITAPGSPAQGVDDALVAGVSMTISF